MRVGELTNQENTHLKNIPLCFYFYCSWPGDWTRGLDTEAVLAELSRLKGHGILTDAEYNAKRDALLAGGTGTEVR